MQKNRLKEKNWICNEMKLAEISNDNAEKE